jgi:hypothetical protein
MILNLSSQLLNTVLHHTASIHSACCCRRSSQERTGYRRRVFEFVESLHCIHSRVSKCSRQVKTN